MNAALQAAYERGFRMGVDDRKRHRSAQETASARVRMAGQVADCAIRVGETNKPQDVNALHFGLGWLAGLSIE